MGYLGTDTVPLKLQDPSVWITDKKAKNESLSEISFILLI